MIKNCGIFYYVLLNKVKVNSSEKVRKVLLKVQRSLKISKLLVSSIKNPIHSYTAYEKS